MQKKRDRNLEGMWDFCWHGCGLTELSVRISIFVHWCTYQYRGLCGMMHFLFWCQRGLEQLRPHTHTLGGGGIHKIKYEVRKSKWLSTLSPTCGRICMGIWMLVRGGWWA